MTRLTMLCGLLIATASLSGPVFAGAHKSAADGCPAGQAECQKPGGRHYGGPGAMGEGMGMWPRMGDKLGMSEDQKLELTALMQIYGPRFKELGERGEAQRKELMAMAPDDAGYSKLTESVSEEAGRAAAEVVVLLAELQTNAYALLTPEQQAKYMEMRSTMRERMQERRAGMGEGGMRYRGHHRKHGDGHVCEHGKDGSCPYKSDGKDASGEEADGEE